MAQIAFFKGLKTNLPTVGVAHAFYYTTDTLEIYKANQAGQLQKYSDIQMVNALPITNIPTGTIYFLTTNNSFQTWNGSQWINLNQNSFEYIEAIKAELDAIIAELGQSIPAIQNRYFIDDIIDVAGTNYRAYLEEPGGTRTEISVPITSNTIAVPTIIASFTSYDGLTAERHLPTQSTSVSIKFWKTSSQRTCKAWIEFYDLSPTGVKVLKGKSETETISTIEETKIFFMPIEEYTAQTGHRGLIVVNAVYEGSGTPFYATIAIGNSTYSRWSYSAATGSIGYTKAEIDAMLGDLPLDTTDQTVYGAINEIYQLIDNGGYTKEEIDNLLGSLPLKTTDQTVYGAINEIYDILPIDKNQKERLIYNGNGDIEKIELSYDNFSTITEERNYFYTGDDITSEVIKNFITLKQKTNVFIYSPNGDIININTTIINL